MKFTFIVQKYIALLLVAAVLVGFSSCASESAAESTPVSETAPVFEAVTETTTERSTEEETSADETTEVETATEAVSRPEPSTKQVVQTAKANITKPQAKQEKAAEPVAVDGVESVTTGSKTIVYPASLTQSKKRWPVISWANGTCCPTWSYTTLLERLAGAGYIVIADDTVMSADGTAQRDSIDCILRLNADKSSAFYQKVDTVNLGVCGHSQGGRSCVNAAQADQRIRCVVSIAGSSYTEEASGLKAPCLFLTGTNDLVVLSAQWCKPAYDAVAGRAAYASLKGGIHTTCMTHPQKVSGYVIDWFDAYLKNDKTARAVFQTGGKLANDSAWRDFANKN